MSFRKDYYEARKRDTLKRAEKANRRGKPFKARTGLELKTCLEAGYTVISHQPTSPANNQSWMLVKAA